MMFIIIDVRYLILKYLPFPTDKGHVNDSQNRT